MSFFGKNAQGQQAINPQNIAMAEQELEMVTGLYNRIANSCHKKCVPIQYEQGELSQTETVCVDACVAKFFEVNTLVGLKMQQMGQQPQ
ncbi:Tim10/DDP family zinc finger-domain-containing protein [Spinellus fusiger]|nr:Tim10/DDP family zinc finger-domain-containing protein [Spinellus fusiger]